MTYGRASYRESRFNAQAIGQQGEIGLMQIKPSTWQEWSPKLGPIDPYDPYSNVLVGTAYLMPQREHIAAWAILNHIGVSSPIIGGLEMYERC